MVVRVSVIIYVDVANVETPLSSRVLGGTAVSLAMTMLITMMGDDDGRR